MKLQAKNLDTPDEKRTFEHGTLSLVTLGDVTIGLAVYQPGWKWSADVRPLVGTDSCQATHAGYVVSGRLRVRTDDGDELALGPGDAHAVPPGHDAWVEGTEPCVVADFALSQAGVRGTSCPCGVAFRIGADGNLEHLIAAVQQHASGSHGHDLTRDHVLAELS
jgi:Cupin domain